MEIELIRHHRVLPHPTYNFTETATLYTEPFNALQVTLIVRILKLLGGPNNTSLCRSHVDVLRKVSGI